MKTIVLKKLGSAEIKDGIDPGMSLGLQSEILHKRIVVYSCQDNDNLKLVLSISKEELFLISSHTWNILREDYSLLPT